MAIFGIELHLGNSDDNESGTNNVDYLFGGGGNDVLQGLGGDDLLVGESGNDALYGGSGNDNLVGDSGNDWLEGGYGQDQLSGGTGDDIYISRMYEGGFDTVYDGKSVTGQTGHGGGRDAIILEDVAAADIRIYRYGTDLVISSAQDAADNSLSAGVVVEDFWISETANYINSDNHIELIAGTDGVIAYDTTNWYA